jgi:hypothetical protein
VCLGRIWTDGGFTVTLFQGQGVKSEVLLEQVQLNFSFQNKFIIVLPFGHQVNNNTYSKVCVFKSHTDYTDGGGYETECICFNNNNNNKIKGNEELIMVISNCTLLYNKNNGRTVP